ncbi:MAG: lycopene cyclase [Pseudomonadota bacterium]
MKNATTSCDIAIAGGGLSAGLIALALAKQHPDLDVRIVEAEEKLGGNHVWSFFDSDVAPDDRWIIEPLICHRWPRYDVRFPKLSRTVAAAYNSIDSAQFDQVVCKTLPDGRILQGNVWTVTADQLTLADGRVIKAGLVIDARGPGDLSILNCGWQKFVGQTFTVPGGHGLVHPIVMDATVEQIDGYRFVYCLPFSADTVFIEDTYYSDTPDLDVPAIRARIRAYAEAKGWAAATPNDEETGVLPVIIGGSFEDYWASTGTGLAKAGLRAGLCQPVTGYSLPDAVRLASHIAKHPNMTTPDFHAYARRIWAGRGFYRMLDAMLFRAAEPQTRYRVLERFYGLSEGLIARFYAGHSTLLDKMRVLAGKPPVPIGRAIRAILENRL